MSDRVKDRNLASANGTDRRLDLDFPPLHNQTHPSRLGNRHLDSLDFNLQRESFPSGCGQQLNVPSGHSSLTSQNSYLSHRPHAMDMNRTGQPSHLYPPDRATPQSFHQGRPGRSSVAISDFLQLEGLRARPVNPPVTQAMANYFRAQPVNYESAADRGSQFRNPAASSAVVLNPASSELVHRRGKERVGPKKKKLSSLKKVILKERAEKMGPDGKPEAAAGAEDSGSQEEEAEDGVSGQGSGEACGSEESEVLRALGELAIEAEADAEAEADSVEESGSGGEASPSSLKGSASLPEITTTTAAAAAAAAVEKAAGKPGAAGSRPATYIGPDVSIRYCTQVISVELNKVAMDLLKELIRFQERAKVRDPIKAKGRRRLVVGLREVSRAVRSGRAKCVIVAPNIEEIKAEGGLDETLQAVLDSAAQVKCEVVFALTRSKIAQAFGRRVRMSSVAICDYDGANALYKEMTALAEAGRRQWEEIHGAASRPAV